VAERGNLKRGPDMCINKEMRMSDKSTTGGQSTPSQQETRVVPADPGARVMILTVPEENVQAVMIAAKLINPDEDVAGFLGVAPVDGPISGTQCSTSGGTFHPSDFGCKDSDTGAS